MTIPASATYEKKGAIRNGRPMVYKKRRTSKAKVRLHDPITDSGVMLLSDAIKRQNS